MDFLFFLHLCSRAWWKDSHLKMFFHFRYYKYCETHIHHFLGPMDKKLCKVTLMGRCCVRYMRNSKKMTTIHFLIRPKIIISRQNCIKKVCTETVYAIFTKWKRRPCLEMNSIQLSVTQCQRLIRVSCFHDFRYRSVFHKMSIEHDFCENQCSDRHTLLKDICGYITYGYKCNCACIFYIFLSIWIKFRRGSGHINSLNDHEFCVKWCNESHKLLKVIRNYTSLISTSIFYLGEICYKVSEHNPDEHLWVFLKLA